MFPSKSIVPFINLWVLYYTLMGIATTGYQKYVPSISARCPMSTHCDCPPLQQLTILSAMLPVRAVEFRAEGSFSELLLSSAMSYDTSQEGAWDESLCLPLCTPDFSAMWINLTWSLHYISYTPLTLAHYVLLSLFLAQLHIPGTCILYIMYSWPLNSVYYLPLIPALCVLHSLAPCTLCVIYLCTLCKTLRHFGPLHYFTYS